jgi:hypothetical protein
MLIQLALMPQMFAVCRFDPHTPAADLLPSTGFFAFTRTEDELSLVVDQSAVQPDWQAETGWRGMKVLGPLDFSLIGILSSLALPLANSGISIFAISTYDTDYLLVKADKLSSALASLREAGFVIQEN